MPLQVESGDDLTLTMLIMNNHKNDKIPTILIEFWIHTGFDQILRNVYITHL